MMVGMDAVDKIVDKTIQGVETLAQTIKNMAPHVWEIMVRQQVVLGVIDIAIGVTIATIAGFGFFKSQAAIRANKKDWYSGDVAGAYASSWAATIICLIIAFCFVKDGALHAFSPEYYAAKDLIEAVK